MTYEVSYEFPLWSGKTVRRNVIAGSIEQALQAAGVNNPTLKARISPDEINRAHAEALKENEQRNRKALMEKRREEREAVQELERLEKKAAKFAATPVEVLKRTDPEALALLAAHCKEFGYHIEIACSPSDFEKTAANISANSSLTEVDAVDYIKIVTEAAQSEKYDLMFPDGLSEDLTNRLGVLLWSEHAGQKVRGFRAKTGEAEINSRQLVEWLMKEHNFMPKKWR